MKTMDSVGPLINDNGVAICDSPCVASMLGKYFVSAISSENTNDLPPIDASNYRDINVLSHIELSSCTIYKNLKNLNPEKSPGVDNICPVVLCNLASY